MDTKLSGLMIRMKGVTVGSIDRKRADIALLSINIYNKSIIRTLYGK